SPCAPRASQNMKLESQPSHGILPVLNAGKSIQRPTPNAQCPTPIERGGDRPDVRESVASYSELDVGRWALGIECRLLWDGCEHCRHVKANPALRDIPLILLTSLSAPQDIIRGLECGADNFVVKPYDDDFLLARIRSVLANRDLGAPADGTAIPVYFAGERYE